METIKEEKKADLEQLLNSLIEKGWYPFGRKYDAEKGGDFNTISFSYYNNIDEERGVANYSMRELVSKESGLWQFVCENHLYIYKMGDNKNFIQDHFKNEYNEYCYQYLWDKSCYEYYLLESSLKDESELEDFLLNSISLHE